MDENEVVSVASKVLEDPSVNFWVKATYRKCLERDPIDAFEDAKLLSVMLRERMEQVLAKGGKP